ncbi:MAG: DUF4340 domain-containing protein [Deltaproteobacteria bacterium]|nr:DUF4340 domain-containing protein [Deltaproteobacteria bacterium]MBW2072606.1 DUF4340 domain-containing protein [Deltaproteobacteria bacterium]
MKAKSLLVMIAVLAGVAVVAFLVVQQKSPEQSTATQGRRLFADLPLNKIEAINLTAAEGSVSLARKNDLWVVASHYDYPADFNKIVNFLRTLKEAKVGRQFKASPETLERLSLQPPDSKDADKESKGLLVELLDGQGRQLAAILFGKPRKNAGTGRPGGGHYLRLPEESRVYLVDSTFSFLPREAPGWLQKRPVQVAAEEVQEVSCLSSDRKKTYYVLARTKRGEDFSLSKMTRGKMLKKITVDRLVRALSSLRIEDVQDPAQASSSLDKQFPYLLEYRLFNGITYRVYPSKTCPEKVGCLLRLQVGFSPPATNKEKKSVEESVKQTAKAADKTVAELAQEAKELNERFSKWLFVTPDWQHNSFVTDRNQLLEEAKTT